jgi:hypothetical protein
MNEVVGRRYADCRAAAVFIRCYASQHQPREPGLRDKVWLEGYERWFAKDGRLTTTNARRR